MITGVIFRNFRSLRRTSIRLGETTLLIGPNNCGKSTVLDAFRALAGALRFARRRRPGPVWAHDGSVYHGFRIPESSIPITTRNIRTDYKEIEARVIFKLENGNALHLIFPTDDTPVLHLEEASTSRTVNQFKTNFPIGLAPFPTLGPFEEVERLVTDATILANIYGRRTHRVFRNIWYRKAWSEEFDDPFDKLRDLLEETWPGMEIEQPELSGMGTDLSLVMFFRERGITREIYWAGFGFQVWLQILTSLLASKSDDILIVDEPEVYLHPDLQRKFLRIARGHAKQVIIATHSVELINDADPDEILTASTTPGTFKRTANTKALQRAVDFLGSSQNIELSRVLRHRRLFFVEGDDFKILRRLMRLVGGTSSNVEKNAIVKPLGGFGEWKRAIDVSWVFETFAASNVDIFCLFDRDYRSREEIREFETLLREKGIQCFVLDRKEIENYLLIVPAVARCVSKEIKKRSRKVPANLESWLGETLSKICAEFKSIVAGHLISENRRYQKAKNSSQSDNSIMQKAHEDFETVWNSEVGPATVVPGKKVLNSLFHEIQQEVGVSISVIKICDELRSPELASDLQIVLLEASKFLSRSQTEVTAALVRAS